VFTCAGVDVAEGAPGGGGGDEAPEYRSDTKDLADFLIRLRNPRVRERLSPPLAPLLAIGTSRSWVAVSSLPRCAPDCSTR